MTRTFAVYGAPILLGRQGERNTRQVVFDLNDWINDYGEGYAQLAVRRPGEDNYYLVPVLREESAAVWEVSAADVGVAGQSGECELSWHSDDGAFVKSQTWRTAVLEALNGDEVDAPDVSQAWLDAARELAAETQRAAEEAKSAAKEAADQLLDITVASELLPEQEITLGEGVQDGSGYLYMVGEDDANYVSLAQIEPGKEYTVVWDGVEYDCAALDISDGFGVPVNKAVLLGNGSFSDAGKYENTGEPFVVVVYDIPGVLSFASIMEKPAGEAESVTRTVRIYCPGGAKIREELLPDGLATEEYVNKKVANVKVEVDDTLKESGMAADSAAVGDRLALIEANVADLMYEPIKITSFTKNTGTTELGDTVNDVTLTWEISKTPVSLTLDGESLDPKTKSLALTGLGLTTEKKWTLTAMDERGATDSRSVIQGFNNRAFYGAAAEPGTVDSDFLLSLDSILTGTRKSTITVDAADGQYIWYAIPVRLGACAFKVGGFDGGFGLAATFDFTNASGYTEAYYVYRSDNPGLGATTVEVS